MHKHGLARVFALVFCLYIILSIPAAFIRADGEKKDYKKDDSDDQAEYYIVDGESVSDLFKFKIYDVEDVLTWAFQFRTFTVIKSSEDDEGKKSYKVYFNTPNLQMLAKNHITSAISDGYTDDTYDPNKNEWLVKVGNNTDKDNAITRYGFSIPSYIYWGEYPQETMTAAGVVPTNWLGAIWRFIKSIFGFSYIKAPDADNYNTIRYVNHGYKDNDDFVLDFLQKYYLKWFVGKMATEKEIEDDYFTGPQDVLRRSISKESAEKAEEYMKQQEAEYALAITKKDKFASYQKECEKYTTSLTSWVAGTDGSSLYVPNAFSMEDAEGEFRSAKNHLTGEDNATLWVARNGHYINTLKEFFLGAEGQAESAQYWNRLAYAYACLYLQTIAPGSDEDAMQETRKSFGMNTGIFSEDKGYFRNSIENLLNHVDDTQYQEKLQFFIEAVCIYPNALSPSTVGSLYVHNGTNLDIVEEGDALVEEDHGNAQNKTYYIAHPDAKDANGNIRVAVNIPGSTVIEFFKSKCLVCFYPWGEDDWLSPSDKAIIESYEEQATIQDRFDDFIDRMENGSDKKVPREIIVEGRHVITPLEYDPNYPMPYILYNQCLIENEGGSGECTSKKYGAETSLSIADVYVYSGLWEITKDVVNFTQDANGNWNNPNPTLFEDPDTLTEEAVIKILNHIRNYTGPYYTDVLSSILKLMVSTSSYDGELDLQEDLYNDDPRVMPYDTSTMTLADREHYQCSDPRVDKYKKNIVGMFVTTKNGLPNLTFPDLNMYIAPQKTVVNLSGKITELSVFMQQLISFDYFDEIGLSPTTMWGEGFVSLVVMALVFAFIVMSAISFLRHKRSLAATLLGALMLCCELGFFFLIVDNPQKVWDTIKEAENTFIYLGERAFISQDESLAYLYGDAEDQEVTYYLPYLDVWSKYNTGYGILDEEQHILDNVGTADETYKDLPELVEMEDGNFPTIGSRRVDHFSVMLMDAFSYYGVCNSPLTAIALPKKDQFGNIVYKTYNGNKINNNAYRVVDHFMAPRVQVTEKDDGKALDLIVSQNENYNGEFQSGFVDLIVKLLNAILMCLLSLIKLLTFLWQWFLWFVLVFKIMFARTTENKNWKEIILETISPTICMIVIGLMAVSFMVLGMRVSGVFGIFLELALFFVVFQLIKWWHNYQSGKFFPKTMVPVYFITNMRDATRHRRAEKLSIENEQLRRDAGMERKSGTLLEETEEFFNEDGTLKSEYLHTDEAKQRVIDDWYKRVYRTERGYLGNRPELLDEKVRRAKIYYENLRAEQTKNMREEIEGKYTKRASGKPKFEKINSPKDVNQNRTPVQTKQEKPQKAPKIRKPRKTEENNKDEVKSNEGESDNDN